jgi:cytochrome c oxidase subunit 2
MTLRFGTVLFAAASAIALASTPALAATGAPTPWELNMQGAATAVAERMHEFNTFINIVIGAIVLFVLVLLAICAVRFNEKSNPVPSRTTHNTWLEVAWTIIPVLVLVAIAIPSFRLLYTQYDMPQADLTIKATGKQWYWSYEYEASKPANAQATQAADQATAAPQAADAESSEFGFDSVLVRDEDLKPGQPRLLTVDNEVVVPVDKVVRLQITGADVIHSFALPSFGLKVDAVPGRLSETWFRAEREGVYHGQCSELCGRDHAYMPITIRVVSQPEYETWLGQAREKFASNDKAPTRAVADATLAAGR